MKTTTVLGETLNKLFNFEIINYTEDGELFDTDEYYTVYENGDIDASNGHCVAEGFCTTEMLAMLGMYV